MSLRFLTSADDSIVPLIGRTGKMLALHLDGRLKAASFDLTVKQWLLLKVLSQEDGTNQTDLAMITDRDKTSLTRLLNTMERKGLIYREIDTADSRTKRVYISDHGHKAYRDTLHTVANAFAEIEEGLTKAEKRIIQKVMRKIQLNVQTNIEKTPTLK